MADLERMNLVVTGHVDHGKSTGLGHMLFLLGQIHDPKKKRQPWRIAERYFNESKAQGMGSWSYAWILDPLMDERERGLTINVSFMEFKTKNFIYNLIDAPGHSDFIKNMITGASQADAAILVVSARKGEFEDGTKAAGTASGKYANVIGMTTEHMLLLISLGITNIVVAINKMDSVNYEQARYEEIKKSIHDIFTHLMKALEIENKEKHLEAIKYVPTSGLVGVNVLSNDMTLKNLEGHISAAKVGKAEPEFIESLEKESEDIRAGFDALAWYDGPSLLEALDILESPAVRKEMFAKQPLRLPIQQTLSIGGVGTVLTGRMSSGILKPNSEVVISPTKQSIEPTPISVKTIQEFHKDIPQALPGDNIGFSIKTKNVGPRDIIRGAVISDPKDPARALKPNIDAFLSLILVVRVLGKKTKKKSEAWGIHENYSPVVHCGTAQVACRVTQVQEKDQLTQNERGMVWMTPLNPLVIEPLTKSPSLGRFALRDSGKTVAVGVVQKIELGKYGS
ncbi:MAG: GTP-binding protein [Candidatus Hodarchaeales archaeon]|jgi:elongation factor 1-alpha